MVSQVVKVASTAAANKPVVTVTKRVVKLSDLRMADSKGPPTIVTPSISMKDGKYSINSLMTAKPGAK